MSSEQKRDTLAASADEEGKYPTSNQEAAMRFAFAIAASALALYSVPASAQIYGSMNVGIGRPAPVYSPAPYYAPAPAYAGPVVSGAVYEETYVNYNGRRGYRGNPYAGNYNYNAVRSVRIEPQGLPRNKYRCDAATAAPASPGNAWCAPHATGR